MKNLFIVLITVFVFVSCKEESTVQPIITNSDPLVGSTSQNMNYTNIDDFVFSVFPHESDGIYYEPFLYALSIYESTAHELLFEVGVSGGGSDYNSFAYCSTRNNWEVCLKDNDSINIKLLNTGDQLQLQNNWAGVDGKKYRFAIYTYYDTSPTPDIDSSGMWSYIENGYMGLRLIQQTDTLYGWLRLSLRDHYEMTIKDYAISK